MSVVRRCPQMVRTAIVKWPEHFILGYETRVSGDSPWLAVHTDWNVAPHRASVAQILCGTLHKISRHPDITHYLVVLLVLMLQLAREGR